MRRDVRLVTTVPVPRERVWEALATREALGRWLMPTDFEPIVGRAFTFRMRPQRGWDGITHCEVTELVPGTRLAFWYRGRARGDKAIACAGVESEPVRALGRGLFAELDTVLRLRLEDAPGGTRVILEHLGFEGCKLVLVSFVMEAGWRKILRTRFRDELAGRR
ncbi:MAG: SRPBCC domain-containing protein [Sandaracinus sp.]